MLSALSHCDELAGRAYIVCDTAVRVAWERGYEEGWWGSLTLGLAIGMAIASVSLYRLWRRRMP